MASSVTTTETSSPGVLTRSKSRQSNGNGADAMGNGHSSSAANGPFGGARAEPEALAAVPEHVPSITELKKSLPAHCFVPTLAQSYYYVAKDFALVAALYAAQLAVERALPAEGGFAVARYAATALYWYLQVGIC